MLDKEKASNADADTLEMHLEDNGVYTSRRAGPDGEAKQSRFYFS